MWRKGKLPTRQRRVLQHRKQLCFQQLRLKEQKERSRRIQNIHSSNAAVRKVLLCKQHRVAVHIGDQPMGSQGLAVGKDRDRGVVLSTHLRQIP